MRKIYKEVIWFVLSLITSLILSFIFLELLNLNSIDKTNELEKIFSIQLYIIGFIVSLICIYLIRFLIKIIKKLK